MYIELYMCCIHMYIYIYIFIDVYIYIYMYVYMYIYIYRVVPLWIQTLSEKVLNPLNHTPNTSYEDTWIHM